MQEIWNPIPGFEKFYEASDSGNIRSLDRISLTSLGKLRLVPGRTLAPQLTGRRYPVVSISIDGVVKTVPVHRLVARAFIPNPLGLREVNHKDGVKTNSAAANLEWSNRADNNEHAVRTGLKPPVLGSRHGLSKFTESGVLSIRSRHLDGASIASLAREYGVTDNAIRYVVQRKGWTHI